MVFNSQKGWTTENNFSQRDSEIQFNTILGGDPLLQQPQLAECRV